MAGVGIGRRGGDYPARRMKKSWRGGIQPENFMSRYTFNEEPEGLGGARITWAVQRLIVANIVIFALQLATDPFLLLLGFGPAIPGGALNPWLGFFPADFVQGCIWMPVSYQFLHGGLMHLFFNMLWLYLFGPDVERVLGTRAFFRFYIICGAVAVLATLIPYVLTGKAPIVVGASGAVMAVLVAFAMVEPERQFFLFPLPISVNARALVIIAFVINVIYSLGGTNISVETHLGGMAVGFLYMKALPLVINFQRERRRREVSRKKKDDKVGEAVDNIFKFDDRKRR